ncbi:MAG: sensor histidine kinase [Sulfurihydrogenibium sp.]|uniref:sensor histidine kinase n=1 Tax=Sulfurihydrogenibium sp. TaxID=2053621 RepID=UPI003C7CCB5B
MKFELKVFLLVMLVFVVTLSVINFINLYVINELLMKYQEVYSKAYPDFMYRFNHDEILDDIKSNYSRVILIWEGILVVLTSFILYFTIDNYLRKERRYKSFLQILILAVSHKFGNSLSSIITNLEILKEKEESPAIKRIEKVVNILSQDIRTLSTTFRQLPFEDRKEEFINIEDVLNNLLKQFDSERKKVFLSVKPLKKYANKKDLEIIFYNLLENAFKYSKSFVHIKVLKKCVVIRNDINKEVEGGSGLGILIVENLCSLNGIKFRKKVSDKHFTVILDFS